MYTTMRYYMGNTELVDALVSNQDDVRRIISEIDGFNAYYLVRSDRGDAISISVFEDQAGAERSNEAAAAWVKENLPDMEIKPPNIAAGEVALTF
jgi:hypothetical protein